MDRAAQRRYHRGDRWRGGRGCYVRIAAAEPRQRRLVDSEASVLNGADASGLSNLALGRDPARSIGA